MSKRINATFDDDTYAIISKMAAKENVKDSEIVRKYFLEGIKLQVSDDNIDFITSIIRTQLKDVMQPNIDRICSLIAKTCVSSAQSSFLNAEAIAKFVPQDRQEDVNEVYEKARLKAIAYTKKKVNDLI